MKITLLIISLVLLAIIAVGCPSSTSRSRQAMAKWTPDSPETAAEWRIYRPPPELWTITAAGQWVLGHGEVAVRWTGPRQPRQLPSGRRELDALSTGVEGETFTTELIGIIPEKGPPLYVDAGLTARSVWFLGDKGNSGSILELHDRVNTGTTVSIVLPRTLTTDPTKFGPVIWMARQYGEERLVLIGIDNSENPPISAELRVLHLPDGTVESTVQVPLVRERFYGEVDESSGTILLVSRVAPIACARVQVATGEIERLAQIPAELIQVDDRKGEGIRSWYRQPEVDDAWAKKAGLYPSEPGLMLFGRPGIALDQYFLQPGRPIHNMTGAMMGLPELLFDPKMQADPQERYLRPALDWGDIETHGLPVRLKAATLQSERTGTRQAVAVDPDTLAAMTTAYARGCAYPLKLHPISIDDVLVSQLVCPGTEQMTDGTGLVRLGHVDQTSLVITWLAWWPLPPELMGTDRRLDLTFATTGDTGWMLVASADAPDQMVDYNTPIYAAQSIPNFDTWLNARLDEVATP